LRTIDPVHNEEIRLSLGAFRTSLVPSILCIAGDPPIQIRRNKEILKYVTRKNLGHHMASQIFTSTPSPRTPKKQGKSRIHTPNYVIIQTASSIPTHFLLLRQLPSGNGPLK